MKKRQKRKRHENISQVKTKEKIHVIGIKENVK